MITNFLLNAILYHVRMSWITCSNKEVLYEMDESNHNNWLYKGPRYKTPICSRLHEILFEYFITHARTDRYILLCYLVANEKKKTTNEDEERIIGDRLIPKHVTT